VKPLAAEQSLDSRRFAAGGASTHRQSRRIPANGPPARSIVTACEETKGDEKE